MIKYKITIITNDGSKSIISGFTSELEIRKLQLYLELLSNIIQSKIENYNDQLEVSYDRS